MAKKEKNLPVIICVDDEPSVLEAFKRVLREDFEVYTAASGEEGLDLLREHPECAVLLSDYMMPKMTGIELLNSARNISPNTIRAIISGQINLQEISEAINSAEIHRFLMKPWDNEYLRIQMLESAQAHQWLTEKSHLQVQAITDPVTQLTNHRYFQEQLIVGLRNSEEKGHPLSLIMIDVDHFKTFNDHFGHPEGDRLLSEIAGRISEACPKDGTASRYGGEEFAVILPNANTKKATDLANKLKKKIEENPFAGPLGKPVHITISLGVATFPDHHDAAAGIVAAADQALYQAKRQGRNLTVVAKKA